MPYIIPNKDTHEYVIGIDFGHGETSADICNIQWQDNYLKLLPPESIEIFNNVNAIKSVLLVENLDGETNYFIGEQAMSRFGNRKKQSSAQQSYYSYFKKAPSRMTPDEREVMESFMREVYIQIRRQRSELTDTNHLVYIACPSNSDKWSDQEQKAYADIALSAGLPLATIDGLGDGIIRESRAAFLKARNNPKSKSSIKEGILLIDFGSSTVDLTYYSTKHTEKPIDDGGAECGASNVEIRITNELKKTVPQVQEAINANPAAETAVLLAVREAKEKYYSFDGEDMEINISLTKLTGGAVMGAIEKYYSDDEIITILAEYIGEIRTCFEQYRDRYLTDKPIKMIFLTGGASRMQFIQDLARDVFQYKGEFYREINPSLTISNGIALAGRADLRSAALLEKLLADEMLTHGTIHESVINYGIEKMADSIVTAMENCYSKLAESGTDSSIASLETEIGSSISRIPYTQIFNNGYSHVLRETVNQNILPKLNTIVGDYFPDETIETITSEKSFSLDISIDSDDLKQCITDSVDSISEDLLQGALKLVGTIVGATATVALSGIATIFGGIRDMFVDEKDRWNVKFGETADSLSEDLLPDWKDKSTVLKKDEREKVYEQFKSKKQDYHNAIISKLKAQKNNSGNLEAQIDKVFREEVRAYVIEQVNKVRLMLN